MLRCNMQTALEPCGDADGTIMKARISISKSNYFSTSPISSCRKQRSCGRCFVGFLIPAASEHAILALSDKEKGD